MIEATQQRPISTMVPTFAWFRWTIILAMLVITLLWPLRGRMGQELWPLMLLLVAYNGFIELLRLRFGHRYIFSWIPILDLPVAALVYFLDHEPGGPTFVLFFLALLSAAVTMTLRGTIIYTLLVVIVVAVIAPTLPGWSATPEDLRQLSSRLVVLVLVGLGTSILTRRLVLEQEQARAVQHEAQRLEELDRLRKEFVSTVSHDLRTPLTAARAGIGLLETSAGERLRPDEHRVLGTVRRNIERLGLLIDDLLTLNQLEAGVLRLDREPLDLRTMITDALSAVYPLVQQKRQVLEVDLPAPLPVEGDARRLEQVVVNVLANAHHHTPPETRITLAGRVQADGVCLTISDTGPGIPPDALEAIFERFHRLPSGDNSGSGLGLAIARAICELHGGRMWAESEPDRGATFGIMLPRYQAQRMEG